MSCPVGRRYDPKHRTCISCALNGAMSCGPIPVVMQPKVEKPKKSTSVPCLKEEAEQEILAQFLDLKFYEEWFHVPNEGRKAIAYHAKMKRQGLKKGVPDNFIMRPVRGAPGVVIELKRVRGGSTSAQQKKWLATLRAFGWITHVAKGAADGIRFVREVYGI